MTRESTQGEMPETEGKSSGKTSIEMHRTDDQVRDRRIGKRNAEYEK